MPSTSSTRSSDWAWSMSLGIRSLATNVPPLFPGLTSNTPAFARTLIAARSVGRLMPIWADRSRSDGRRVPTLRSPTRIASASCSDTPSNTRRVDTGLNISVILAAEDTNKSKSLDPAAIGRSGDRPGEAGRSPISTHQRVIECGFGTCVSPGESVLGPGSAERGIARSKGRFGVVARLGVGL